MEFLFGIIGVALLAIVFKVVTKKRVRDMNSAEKIAFSLKNSLSKSLKDAEKGYRSYDIIVNDINRSFDLAFKEMKARFSDQLTNLMTMKNLHENIISQTENDIESCKVSIIRCNDKFKATGDEAQKDYMNQYAQSLVILQEQRAKSIESLAVTNRDINEVSINIGISKNKMFAKKAEFLSMITAPKMYKNKFALDIDDLTKELCQRVSEREIENKVNDIVEGPANPEPVVDNKKVEDALKSVIGD